MLLAVIREAECIGCAKCLPACPVDAIIGANTFLHTVLTDECIGCGLCVAPCPMDCIEMQETAILPQSDLKHERAQLAKKRYQLRQERLRKESLPQLLAPLTAERKTIIQQEIKAAIHRVETKKNHDKHH